MGVGLSFGESSTAGGPTSLAPKFTGLREVGYEAEFEVDGENRKAILAVIKSNGVGVTEETKVRNYDYVPAVTQNKGEPPKPSAGRDFGIKFNSSAKVGIFETLDTAGPFLTNVLSSFGLILEAQGTVDIFYRFNMSPYLGFIPYAGPVLVSFDRLGGLSIFGRFETTLGAKFTMELETQYPQPVGMGTVERGTVLPETQWSLLGQTKSDLQAKLIYRVAAGLEISAFGDHVSGIVLLQLGAPTGASDVDGVFISLNLDGNYPLIKSEEGALSVVIRVSANLGPLSYSKNYQIDIGRFIVDRNSTPSFDLFPMNVTFVQVTPATASRETFFGTGSSLISDFYTAGKFELSSDGEVLVFTGIDSDTGKMTVMASRAGGDDWLAPLKLTSAAGILSLAIAPLPAGGWIAVWSEIDAEAVGDPFPDSTLHYAISNTDGSAWSAPALLGSETGEAFDLKLVTLGSQVLLTYQCSIEGPFRDNSRLCYAVYAPGVWTTPMEFVPSTSLAEYEVTGDLQQMAHLAYSSREGEVRFLSFDTTSGWGGTSLVSTNSDGRIALAWNPTNQVNLLWQNQQDSAELSQWTVGGSSWNHLGVIFTNIACKELELRHLHDGSQDLLLASWIEGSANATIRHAYLDVVGGVLLEPRETVLDSTGTFRGLRIRPEVETSRTSILAVQTTPTNNVVRRFQVGLPTAGDANGNGIPDDMEITMAMVQDQNTNGIPDSVEIADGQLEDRNRNGVPDLFEEAPVGDCNRNGLADSDEIFLGLETDVNRNGILDSCEGISTRTVPILPQKLSEFYRGQRIIIRELRPNEMVLEFEGNTLEKSDTVNGGFRVVE